MTSGSSSPRCSLRSGIAAELEHRENVGVGQLELQRKADDVEVAERSRALERHQKLAVGQELALHVHPRRVTTLGERARVVVQDLVENPEAEMAHPDVVDVRERQAHARRGRAPVLAAGAVFGTRVAARLFHPMEESRVGMIEELDHGGPEGRL